jgi:hypothetical protein
MSRASACSATQLVKSLYMYRMMIVSDDAIWKPLGSGSAVNAAHSPVHVWFLSPRLLPTLFGEIEVSWSIARD